MPSRTPMVLSVLKRIMPKNVASGRPLIINPNKHGETLRQFQAFAVMLTSFCDFFLQVYTMLFCNVFSCHVCLRL